MTGRADLWAAGSCPWKRLGGCAKAGDRILFGKWSGTEVKIDGEDLLVMKESDIMGVIDATASKAKAA